MKYDLKSIGDRAYKARVTKRINQEDLSETIGVAQSSLSRFESGIYDMPVTKVMALCDALCVSISWMLYGDSKH